MGIIEKSLFHLWNWSQRPSGHFFVTAGALVSLLPVIPSIFKCSSTAAAVTGARAEYEDEGITDADGHADGQTA